MTCARWDSCLKFNEEPRTACSQYVCQRLETVFVPPQHSGSSPLMIYLSWFVESLRLKTRHNKNPDVER